MNYELPGTDRLMDINALWTVETPFLTLRGLETDDAYDMQKHLESTTPEDMIEVYYDTNV